jgi:hypothetical protein
MHKNNKKDKNLLLVDFLASLIDYDRCLLGEKTSSLEETKHLVLREGKAGIIHFLACEVLTRRDD